MGSNKLGMAGGWSSAFETQMSVVGNIDQAGNTGTVVVPEDTLRPASPTRLKNVPSFRTLLKDYTVQGPNRFEAPVYEDPSHTYSTSRGTMSFSDCLVTSPYNINALFNRHVVRIGKRISQRIYLHLTTNSLKL